jgi:hypothetical protein
VKSAQTAHILSLPHQIESAGVDWITATAPRTRTLEPLYERVQQLVISEADEGNDKTPWKWQGYNGVKCGGASVGIRRDGVIAQLRSDTARDHWQDIMPLAANVSRIDLQLTARLDEAHRELIRAQYARLRRAKRLRGRPLDATLIDNPTRGSSLYLGRRACEKFARMYDKGAEEKTSPPGTLIRWEVEYKKKSALQMASGLARAGSVDTVAAATVSEHFRSRRIQCIEAEAQGLEIPRAPSTSSDATRMAYIRAVIAPMLARMMKSYTRAELAEALGLTDEGYMMSSEDVGGTK